MFVLLFLPNISHAEIKPINLQVPIGQTKTIQFEDGYGIGRYINALYKYAIGIVGVVAAAVIMWSGFSWIMAGGNPQKISKAKSWLTNALGGLVLAMTAFLILQTINPDLVKIKPIQPVKIAATGNCCDPTKGRVVQQVKEENGKQIAIACHSNQKINTGEECVKVGTAWKVEKLGCCLYQEYSLVTRFAALGAAPVTDCQNQTVSTCVDTTLSNSDFKPGKKCQEITETEEQITNFGLWKCIN